MEKPSNSRSRCNELLVKFINIAICTKWKQIHIFSLYPQVKSANKLLDQSQQPYHYLVESVRVRDGQISKQREHIDALEDDVKRLERERAALTKAKNNMAIDLEKLLNHKEVGDRGWLIAGYTVYQTCVQ